MENKEKSINKVCIKCFTYNHSSYIIDAMNGFCTQKTNFPFICTIVDDASTDGEPDVIKKYLEENFDLEDHAVFRKENTDDYVLIYARHNTNENCYFVVLFLKYNHNGCIEKKKRKNEYISEWINTAKYIAICEGDDYWTDSHKLQKQVDYLESHPDCGMVYTNANVLNQNNGIITKTSLPHQANFEELLVDSPIMTLTVCYRSRFLEGYETEKNNLPKLRMGDLPLWLYIASQSAIKYMPDVTSVYRILSESASHSKDINKNVLHCFNSYDIRKYYAKKLHCESLIKTICMNHINELFKIEVLFDKNISKRIIKFASKESLYNIKTWLKIVLFSTKFGRKFHKKKYIIKK